MTQRGQPEGRQDLPKQISFHEAAGVQYCEVDLSTHVGLSRFDVSDGRRVTHDDIALLIDARFSHVEGLLYEHGVSPLHVERSGSSVIAIRVDGDVGMTGIVSKVLELLHRAS